MPPNLGGFFMVRSYYPSECHADYFDFERIEALKPAIEACGISTLSQQATTNQNVKKRPACSELRWAYCNHKATYFASYLTGGDCVPRSEERFSRNAETDLVCRLLLEKKKEKNKGASGQDAQATDIVG